VCETDLMPQLGRTAALLARLMQTDGSSSSGSSSSSGGRHSSQGSSNSPAAEVSMDTLFDLMAAGVLGLWEAVVTSENKEEGVSISQPQCLKALEPICALTRAVLCKLSDPQSLREALVKDSEGAFGLCMHVANYVCGHLHMQVICFWPLLVLHDAAWVATVAKPSAACRWAS